MQQRNCIDVCLLLVIGLIFTIIFPGTPYHGSLKPDFILAGFFVLIGITQSSVLMLLSVFFVSIFSTFLSGIGNHMGSNFLAVFITGTLLYLVVRLIRIKIHPAILITISAVVGTILYKLMFALIIGDSLFAVMPVVELALATFLNTGIAYVFYVGWDFAERMPGIKSYPVRRCSNG